MQEIPLEIRPNQAFTLVLNSRTYRIRIFDVTGGLMCADVSLNTTPVVQGVRCLHGDFLLPFPGLEQDNGNFLWFDDRGRRPNWANFGSDPTCRLYYVPGEEMGAARARVAQEAVRNG